jgi:hypothetical protein
MERKGKKKGGAGKYGRNKRPKNELLSKFVRGIITGEEYFKRLKKK